MQWDCVEGRTLDRSVCLWYLDKKTDYSEDYSKLHALLLANGARIANCSGLGSIPASRTLIGRDFVDYSRIVKAR